jgi:hypothetical protein
MKAVEREGWMPINVSLRPDGAQIDWCQLMDVRFTEPFFEQTITRALRDPARLLFRLQTPLAALEAPQNANHARSPRGFVFHVSRCGSTLVSQLLAALPQNHVVSEAPPLDQLLETLRRDTRISHEQRISRLRGMINVLGRYDAGSEQNYFIKFDSWHVLELPLIIEAFPEVPWIFLYRDPVEVMVSQHRQRGSQMVPGLIDPRIFDLESAAALSMPLDEYCARVLAQIYTAAATHLPLGRGRLVNFSELPAAVWGSFGDFFGVAWTPEDLARMKSASLQNAKAPESAHSSDSEAKQREASPLIRRLAAEWLDAPYEKLEALRRAQAGPSATVARAASVSSSSRNQSLTTQSITR